MAKILVVDDDVNNRLLLRTLLESVDHVVHEAASAAEGLRVIGDAAPDLVIVDLHMPEVDGVSFIRTLRNDPDLASLEIALYTGTSPSAALEDFLDLYGVKTIIPKPCEPEELLQRVRSALISSSSA